MNWKEVEGFQTEKPAEIDTTSSPTTVYFRKNIREVPNEGEGTHWKYDEAQIMRDDYNMIAATLIIEKQYEQDQVIAEILLNQMEV